MCPIVSKYFVAKFLLQYIVKLNTYRGIWQAMDLFIYNKIVIRTANTVLQTLHTICLFMTYSKRVTLTNALCALKALRNSRHL